MLENRESPQPSSHPVDLSQDSIERQLQLFNSANDGSQSSGKEHHSEEPYYQDPASAKAGKKLASKTPTLDKFGRDITALARAKQIDPIIGRANEIERALEILSRRTKNNPLFLGEAGVGKTAIVEGIALLLVSSNVPPHLEGKRIVELDIAGMVAGTQYRGQFEERIKAVLKEVETAKDVIVFIDEIHTMVGAGGTSGSLEMANILKPALARGVFHCIGATTLDEYRKSIEKDPALSRRFQPIVVNAPSAEDTLGIMRGIKSKFEAHHKVRIPDEALREAVTLSQTYINERNFPDKAIDVIDEACSRAQVSKRGELGLDDIRQVVSSISRVPLQKLSQSDAERYLALEKEMGLTVVDQDEAISAIARAIRKSKAGLRDTKRPIGSFLFLGPTGVGKTLVAKTLAEFLCGSEDALIPLDMSNFMEKSSVSRLVGAPPGYVGYEEGGQLTEQIRRRPYSVILLDEVEKAHPDVFNMLLQVLEEGRLTDSFGREVDFKNTIIVMTSNLGASEAKKGAFGFGAAQGNQERTHQQNKQIVLSQLESFFRPEFVNRLDEIVVFRSLSPSSIAKIAKLEIGKFIKLAKSQGFNVEVNADVENLLSRKGYDPEYGGRPMRRAVDEYLSNPFSDAILSSQVKQGENIIAILEGEKIKFVPLERVPLPSRHSLEALPAAA